MILFNRNFSPDKMRLLIFDLDGTLIDSCQDLIDSVNATLREFRHQELPAGVITSYVGDGLSMLMRRALGEPKETRLVREATEFLFVYYGDHLLDKTHTFPGVAEMLAAVREPQNGIKRHLAVLSNKRADLAVSILKGLGLAQYFDSIYGGNSFHTQKPDPLGAMTILKETETPQELGLMIGDSPSDVLTGRNAGMWTCGVKYGFAPLTLRKADPDLLVDSTEEMISLLAPNILSLQSTDASRLVKA